MKSCMEFIIARIPRMDTMKLESEFSHGVRPPCSVTKPIWRHIVSFHNEFVKLIVKTCHVLYPDEQLTFFT